MQFVPRKYQEPIIEELAKYNNYGLLAFPGSGKTVMALHDIYEHKEPSLIIAPLEIIATTWRTEHLKWDFSKTLKTKFLHGPNKDVLFHKRTGVTLINPEGLPWLLKKIVTTKTFPWKRLYVDESIKFKNHKSQRFKILVRLLKSFEARRILCGNPVPNNYMDLWAQIFILDLGERLGKSWYSYRNRYFYPTDYKRFNWVLKPDAKEEIIASISDIVYFIAETDELDIPERVEIDHPIPLPKSVQKIYKTMEEQLFAQLDETTFVDAAARSAALMKCWQIAQGFLYEKVETTGKIKTHLLHESLITFAKSLVESLQGSPIIIAYHFRQDLSYLKKAFPNAVYVNSQTPTEDYSKIEASWNNGEIPILIAYISKLSHGLNLQYGPGHQILFYCLTCNFDIYDQLIRRIQRQGAKHSRVIAHRAYMIGTVHEAIMSNLSRKADDSHDFLQTLKEYKEGKQ